jgi:(2Fe-2S) ferredoxin
MPRPEHIVFVCQNQRPPEAKPSCANAGSGEVLAALRAALQERPELLGRVRVAASSCLGPCFEGPHVVAYPEDRWWSQVRPEQAGEILDAIEV